MGGSPLPLSGNMTTNSPMQQRDGFLRSMGFTGEGDAVRSGAAGRVAGSPTSPNAYAAAAARSQHFQQAAAAGPGVVGSGGATTWAAGGGGSGSGPSSGGVGVSGAARPGICRGVAVKIQVCVYLGGTVKGFAGWWVWDRKALLWFGQIPWHAEHSSLAFIYIYVFTFWIMLCIFF